MSEPHRLLIALGANLSGPSGTPRQTLDAALRAMDEAGLAVRDVSRFYATPAFPPGAGPDFVNAAAACETALPPAAALEVLHTIERDLGRVRDRRWAPRACDLDLLAAGDTILPDRDAVQTAMRPVGTTPPPAPDRLFLPHPRLHERAFVLVPLADIAPDWCHPVGGRSVREMRDACAPEDLAQVRPLDP